MFLSRERTFVGSSTSLFVRSAGQKPIWHLCTIKQPKPTNVAVPVLTQSAPRANNLAVSSALLTAPAVG